MYAGNTGDSSTVADQAQKLPHRFGLQRAVVIGDRGCITNTTIQTLRKYPALGWIGALKSGAIRALVKNVNLETSLFDHQNLGEITSDDYPGERLIACSNPLMAQKRGRKRQQLMAATEKQLNKLVVEVKSRTKNPLSASEIGVKGGRKVKHFKVAKHFEISIDDGSVSWKRNRESVQQEKLIDGIYVVRTSEPAQTISTPDTVRQYKSLSHIGQAFRCIKTVDLPVRPIFLRNEDHVKAYIFLCVLAYYLQWHLRQSLAELLIRR